MGGGGTGGGTAGTGGGGTGGDMGGGTGGTSRQQCLSSQPFGAPTPVLGLVNVVDDFWSFSLSPDEQIAYVGVLRAGQPDIMISSRTTRFEPFRPGTLLSAVNSPYEDSWVTVTGDGLTLYLSSARAGQYQLFTASRAFVAAEFSTPKPVASLNVYGEGGPYITPDGSVLYFHSWRASGNADLYRAVRNGSDFDPPARLANVNTSALEVQPVVTPDELTIYYLTQNDPLDRDGIWTATRASVVEPFANAVFLPELNGLLDAIPGWISPDGCRLYYSQRHAASQHRPYVVERIGGTGGTGGGTAGTGGGTGGTAGTGSGGTAGTGSGGTAGTGSGTGGSS